ncbi:MAG: DUF397 domain-containing protein [Pseudonocardiaceae bacterium]
MNHHQALAELTTAAGWRKSSYSQGANNCVEVTTEVPGWVGVRDTKNRDAGLLALNQQQWDGFLDAVKNGQFVL